MVTHLPTAVGKVTHTVGTEQHFSGAQGVIPEKIPSDPEMARKQPENRWRQEPRRSSKSASCEPEAPLVVTRGQRDSVRAKRVRWRTGWSMGVGQEQRKPREPQDYGNRLLGDSQPLV